VSVLLIGLEVRYSVDTFCMRKEIIFTKRLCQGSNIYSMVILQIELLRILLKLHTNFKIFNILSTLVSMRYFVNSSKSLNVKLRNQ
jgi:hypothetical protein